MIDAQDWLTAVAHLLAVLVITVTLLPLWHTPRWWVRIWDFPRFQIALFASGLILLWPLISFTKVSWILLGGLVAAFAWQMSWVWRYLPGAPREMAQASGDACGAACVALLATNVL